MSNASPFKWRHFESESILLCVRWYLRYSLSYRDLEEMMLERGLHVDHTTIYRWVQRYAPELEKRCRPHLKATNDSWRVDETYVKVKKPGCTSIEPWTPKGTRSSSGSVQHMMQKRLCAFSPKRWAPLTPSPQHHR
jgi:hypothetical protein